MILPHVPLVGVIRRHRTIGAVVLGPSGVVDLTRTLAAGPSCHEKTRRLITELALDYGTSRVVVEPGSPVETALANSSELTLTTLSLTESSAILLAGSSKRPTQSSLIRRVLGRLPVLSRFASESSLRLDDRRSLTLVFAAALVLAAGERLTS